MTTSHPSPPQAVVIGAGMAGLLAARVLSDHYRVIVLDRDTARPGGPTVRGGVPQGAHPHGLLARGCEILEELFPGLTQELIAAGALPFDLHRDASYRLAGRTLRRADSGLLGIAVSRPLLEHHTRLRVTGLPRVVIRRSAGVSGLLPAKTGNGVGGVIVGHQHAQGIRADLVVDASGRSSRVPQWLTELGHARPVEEAVRVDRTSTTRVFYRNDSQPDSDLLKIWAASPEHPRGGILLGLEGGRWMASIGGYRGDGAPLDLDGWTAFADTVSPELADIVREGTPAAEPRVFRFLADARRRYDDLRQPAAGLVAMGDALCTFNPVFGQGITIAALEALALRDCLQDGTTDLPRRFFAASKPVVDVPWQTVVEADRRIVGAAGRRSVAGALRSRYVRRLQAAAHHDVELASAFVRVMNMKASPASLLHPRLMVKVLALLAPRSVVRAPARPVGVVG